MKKELRPFHEHVVCDVCGRTMLKGERAEPYLSQAGERHTVCELCSLRAEHSGWLREAADPAAPARDHHPQERRALFGRRRRRQRPAPTAPAAEPAPPAAAGEAEPVDAATADRAARRERPRESAQDPRQVRAVPTTAEVKVDRGLELFNGSSHQRTVAGLTRSLGLPWVTVRPDVDAQSVVVLVVAWELSWYRFRIDLGDASDPVSLAAKGDELDELGAELRDWNGSLDGDGRVVIGLVRQ